MWEKVDRSDAVLHRRGDIPIHHRYTMGVAGERFFRAMRDEKRLLASRCPGCRTAFLPPKMYCERLLRGDHRLDTSGRGGLCEKLYRTPPFPR